MSLFLDQLSAQVLLCDGALGSRIQAMGLSVARDFDGHERPTPSAATQ